MRDDVECMQMQQEKAPVVACFGGQQPAMVDAPKAYIVNGVQQQQPTVVGTLNSKHLKIIGIVLIVCAVMGFIFNSVELGVGVNNYNYYGFVYGLVCHGFWNGISVKRVWFLSLVK